MSQDITIVSSIVKAMHPEVSPSKTSNYTITSSDYVIAIGTLASSITITLPNAPAVGDQYIIKDTNGSAGQYPIIIDGYGKNIDGYAQFVMAHNYSSYTFLYTGIQWSIMISYAGQQNGNGFGALSSRPVQGQSGRTFYATDQSVFYYDDGQKWNPIGTNIKTLTLPKLSDFTWVNQGTAIATDTGSGLSVAATNITGGSRSAKMLVKAMPATPFKVDVCIQYAALTNFGAINGPVGLCFRDSTTGKIHALTIDIDASGNCYMASSKYDSPTSFNSNYVKNPSDFVGGMIWLRMTNNGTLREFWFSKDGIVYNNFNFCASNDFMTPDQIGFLFEPIYQQIRVVFQSWTES